MIDIGNQRRVRSKTLNQNDDKSRVVLGVGEGCGCGGRQRQQQCSEYDQSIVKCKVYDQRPLLRVAAL